MTIKEWQELRNYASNNFELIEHTGPATKPLALQNTGNDEPCSICQSGEVTYIDYGTGEEWHKPARFCPDCGQKIDWEATT